MARWKRLPLANHRLRADDMRRHPGMWIEVGSYLSRQTAENVAWRVRTAYRWAYYEPAGAFETRTTPADDGTTTLYARYTGATK